MSNINERNFKEVLGSKENYSLFIIENLTKKEYLVIRNKDFKYCSMKTMFYYEFPTGIYCILLNELNVKQVKSEFFIPNNNFADIDYLDITEFEEKIKDEIIITIPVTSRIQATKDNIIKFYNDILTLNKIL